MGRAAGPDERRDRTDRLLTRLSRQLGSRVGMVDQDGGVTTYAYDPRGQLAEVVNPFGEATTWSWDALGREARQSLANGVTVSQTYDPAGRAASRVYYDPEGVELAMYTASYDPVGNRTGVEELDGGLSRVA